MGVYNAESTLLCAINSVLEQSFFDIEFIICDDGSVDGSARVIQSEASKDSRIVFIQNDKNRGLAYSLNCCIKFAKGEFLVRQDADDVSLPGRLSFLHDSISNRPDLAVLGTDVDLYDGERVWGRLSWPESPAIEDWAKGAQIIHPSCIMRKSVINELGGYDSTALRVEDMDLWFRLLLADKKIANVHRSFYRFTWRIADYQRKRTVDRLREFCLRLKYFHKLRMPLKSFLYILKPLFLIFVPSALLYRSHVHRFTTGQDDS